VNLYGSMRLSRGRFTREFVYHEWSLRSIDVPNSLAPPDLRSAERDGSFVFKLDL
jgi:hypothetical protein